MYIIDSPLRHSIVSHKVEIRKQLGGDFAAYFADRKLTIAEIKEPCKLTEYGEEVQRKLDTIKLAEELGNLSEAARISGCSRESIYNNRRLLEAQGPLALKRMYGISRHTNRIDQDVEDKVIELTLEKPHLTQIPISSEMMIRHNISISHSTIRNIWVREKLNTKVLRIERAEALAKTP